MNTQELFPETLLVSREGEHIYTTSRRVAFYFGKRHDHVLRAIKNVMLDLDDEGTNETNFGFIDTPNRGGDAPNFGGTSQADFPDFELSHYVDEWNRQKPEYLLSHDGFMFLTMGFTGRKASHWKKTFIRAFRRMESELADHHARRIAALDTLHPNLLPTVEDYEQGLPRCTTAQRLGRSVAAVTYHRRKARRLGLLPSVARAVAQ